jgi:hypothetical protein
VSAGSEAFEAACSALNECTEFGAPEARGTIRLILKEAGLHPSDAFSSQLNVVLENLLPKELDLRGVADSTGVTQTVCCAIAGLADAGTPDDSPKAIFQRLGGS